MRNQVENRIRFEFHGEAEAGLRKVIALLTPAPDDAFIAALADGGRAEAPFDPYIVAPMPAQLAALPEAYPEKIDLALAIIAPKWDFVAGRHVARNPNWADSPLFSRPSSRSEIERHALATKSPVELLAWAEEKIPAELRLATQMKLAKRDTGYLDQLSWFNAKIGSHGLGETVTLKLEEGALVIGFESLTTAPLPWFRALAEAIEPDGFASFSWHDQSDYSMICAAPGNGRLSSNECNDPEGVVRAKAGAGVRTQATEPEYESDDQPQP